MNYPYWIIEWREERFPVRCPVPMPISLRFKEECSDNPIH